MKTVFKKILMVFPLGILSVAFLYLWKFICALLNISAKNPEIISGCVVSLSLSVTAVCLRKHKIRGDRLQLNGGKETVLYILKSKDYISKIISFEVISAVFVVAIGIENNTPFLPLVLGAIILIIVSSLAFAIIDFCIWLAAYKIP